MTLHLLPNLLDEHASAAYSLVPILHEVIYTLDGFFVEHPKEARKYLKCFDFSRLRDKPMEVMDKNGNIPKELLDPLRKGESWGVVSDAGLPCIADPGSYLVAAARREKIRIVAYPGPCSITHALSLSGLSGNGFTFHGYFPRHPEHYFADLKGVHIFIETPYNNQKSLKTLLTLLGPKDVVAVASDLMTEKEEVLVYTVREWESKIEKHDFYKRQVVFVCDLHKH